MKTCPDPDPPHRGRTGLKVLCPPPGLWLKLPQNTRLISYSPRVASCMPACLKPTQIQELNEISNDFQHQRQRGERMFLISSWVPFCRFSQRTEALGQTAPSLSKPSAQTEKGEHTEDKWSRRLCTSSRNQDHKSKWCMKEMYRSICPTERRQMEMKGCLWERPDFMSAWGDHCSNMKPACFGPADSDRKVYYLWGVC